ncbi:MAG: gliding motility-associated C-terminal domain-containing protein, partial [Chitinophagales bacterium]
GCTATTTFTISQPDEISIYAGPDLSIIFGATVTIEAEPSTFELSGVTWSPGGGILNCESDPCFSYTVYPSNTTYIVVGITDLNGCFTSDSVLVTVIFTNEVLMPTAFTPNNDGINDLFQGIAFDLATYNLQIYNRWGALVYETNSIDYSQGWDGKYNGEDQEVGAYVYSINALFNTGITYTKSGTFNLIR